MFGLLFALWLMAGLGSSGGPVSVLHWTDEGPCAVQSVVVTGDDKPKPPPPPPPKVKPRKPVVQVTWGFIKALYGNK